MQLLRNITADANIDNHLKRHRDLYAEFEAAAKTKTANQPSIADVLNKKVAVTNVKRHALDQKVARMIALDFQPYTIVEDSGFKDLLQEAVPGYQLPSRTTLSRTLVPKLYDDTRKKVELELARAFQHGLESLSFTTDIWTSRANESYISLTCHYMDQTFKLGRYNLNTCPFPGNHTSARIASVLEQLVSNWEVPVTVCPFYVVRDNAHNMRAATRGLSWHERSRSHFAVGHR
ncbi:hypothetical protein HPB48_020356 [Haemaphysalis longicornis]|uniref:Uncharacterized protein n=1 Tax=Haemaphysalis longicornis TaxID=44386 RepID=A0A9J6H651_HAELO|nr:hypothetical protein HPB48_020356 [Haemaphysalis longicornis]